MRLVYEWETKEVVESFERAGNAFIERICQDWSAHNKECFLGTTVCDIVWPSLKVYINALSKEETSEQLYKKLRENTVMTILPLDRMGQEQGQSGTQSVLCYFAFHNPRTSDQTLYSLPIIIKRGEAACDTRESKIKDEFQRAKEISQYLRHSQTFVLPFYYYPDDCIEFLLSSSIVDYNGTSVSLTNGSISTLMDLLYQAEASHDESDMEHIRGILHYIYRKLRYLHCGPNDLGEENSKCELHYQEEYEKYLRHMTSEEEKKAFQKMWCNTEGNYGACGRDCPLQLLDELLNLKHELHVGGLHGDVHPRNIVFLGKFSYEAYLIDYGWANKRGHIAKDFVLMECNLRYMALYPKLPDAERKLISGLIETDEIKSYLKENTGKKSYAAGILVLIQDIREEFEQTIRQLDRMAEGSEIDGDTWLYEYYIPLFLITYGLAKFYDGCRNQIAMRETIAAFTKFLMEKKSTWKGRGMDA